MWMLLISAVLLLVVFLTYVVINFKVLPSFSDSFYLIKNNWLFPVVIITFSVLVMIASLMWGLIIMPIACGFLMLVGAAPRFKTKEDVTFHIIGAVGGIALATISLVVELNLLWLVGILILLIGILKLSKVKNTTWWVELSAFLIVVAGLFISCKNSDKKK